MLSKEIAATTARGSRPANDTPLRVDCLTSTAQLESLAPEWRALFERAGDALPFATFEWAAAWWAHMRRTSGAMRDALQLFVVRDGTGAVVAIAPMMHTGVRVAGVRVARALQPIGTDPNLTEVRGMLVDAAHEGAVLETLARWVTKRGGQQWVQWCGVRRSGPGLERLRSVRPAVVTKETPAFILALPASWDEFKAGFPRNLKESLRKCYNSLARDGHEWSFRVVEDPVLIAAAVDRLIALHGMRAQRTDTIVHRDVFDSPQARRFLHDVAARLAARGIVRVFQLEIAGQVVATRMGFVFGDRMYLYYSGYDPEWGRYSVMTTVVAEALRWAMAQGIREVNLSTGPDESKLRWRPTRVEYDDAVMVGRGPLARLAYHALQGAGRAKLKRLFGRE